MVHARPQQPCAGAAGFTLIEMMVVLAVSLLLMSMVAPMFQVSTRAVKSIERKLAVYEAARNILDVIELDIQQAALNERGEHFSLKRVTFTDTDAFTPAGGGRFTGSQREAGSLNYLKHQAGGLIYNGNTAYLGAMPFPLAYPNGAGTTWEGYIATVRSGLLYDQKSDLKTRLADVSQIESFTFANPKSQHPWTTYNAATGVTTWHITDEPEDFAAPGHEVSAPNYIDCSSTAYYPYAITPVHFMDIAFAYWDEAASEFKDPPDGTAIYFAPPPKAVRCTITVCDFDKRATAQFTRVILIPCGWGSGAVSDTRDAVLSDPSTPLFNRTKDLNKVDPTIFGAN